MTTEAGLVSSPPVPCDSPSYLVTAELLLSAVAAAASQQQQVCRGPGVVVLWSAVVRRAPQFNL